ncbi:MAG: hypothetical protein IPL95_13190 [Saprospiraceae bacterium]|nr:hypothetical protein [Saprospiraceae bacterium]
MVDRKLYTINGRILLVDDTLVGKNITLKGRKITRNLFEISKSLDTSLLKKSFNGGLLITEEDVKLQNDLFFKKKGLDYSGVYSRGINLGNNQNLSLNSNFNIQMNGLLGDDILVNAVLNDNNIPIQPDGNTQRLQDFDRIFIQLSKNGHAIKAGDYDVVKPTGYFLNYYKKLQGGQYFNTLKINKNLTTENQVSYALTRGKFNRQEIKGIERNQGPYRLQGKDNERFIIILSGSEKVYLDGNLLKRGIDEDYIIDYNRADVTFTNRKIITNYSRIIIEFEYNTASYNRSLWIANTKWNYNKFQFYINAYSEQDGKNLNNGTTLNEEAIKTISNSTSNEIELSGIELATAESNDPIRYKKIDTLVNGKIFSVLQYDISGNGLYIARFTDVGTNQGNYIRSGNSINGQVYIWVAPNSITGIPSGNYEPIYKLIAPAKNQLFSFGSKYEDKKSKIEIEYAKSLIDRNRFSTIKDSLNNGNAFSINYQQLINFDTTNKWKLTTNAHFEILDKTFRFLNPFRNAEFTRDWNIQAGIYENELLGTLSATIQHFKLGSLRYETNYYTKENVFNGAKQVVNLNTRWKGWESIINASYLKSNQFKTENATFIRPNIEISKSFGKKIKYKIGAKWEMEKNEVKNNTSDSINLKSFWFDTKSVFFQRTESESFAWKLQYSNRIDYIPNGLLFKENTNAQDFNFEGKWNQNKDNVLTFSFIKRNFKTNNTQQLNNLLGRLDQQVLIKKGLVRGNLTYEISSGQEQKIEYNYLKVYPGQGNYIWIDRNKDDVAQLDEFEIAPIAIQADYIRVVVLSNQFVPTNNVNLNAAISIDPRIIYTEKTSFGKIIRKFTIQSNLKVLRKIRSDTGENTINPFSTIKSDTSLVNSTFLLRNLLQFNRSNTLYDIQFTQTRNFQRLILINGLESRILDEFLFRTRVNYSKQLSSILTLGYIEKSNNSQSLTSRNYFINTNRVEHQFLWIYKSNFRADLSLKYDLLKNKIGLNEQANINNNSIELTYNQSSKSNFRGKVEWVKINYNGLKNTALEFILLDGLQNGTNFIWSLQYDQRITQFTQLSINYDARKSELSNTIHNIRAQIRATF